MQIEPLVTSRRCRSRDAACHGAANVDGDAVLAMRSWKGACGNAAIGFELRLLVSALVASNRTRRAGWAFSATKYERTLVVFSRSWRGPCAIAAFRFDLGLVASSLVASSRSWRCPWAIAAISCEITLIRCLSIPSRKPLRRGIQRRGGV